MTPSLQIPANPGNVHKTPFCGFPAEINGFSAHRKESPPPELHWQSKRLALGITDFTIATAKQSGPLAPREEASVWQAQRDTNIRHAVSLRGRSAHLDGARWPLCWRSLR
ncbi:MAG: hypothetical protein ACOVQM_01615 [Pirellula sp.]|jgi:hypothetical protein